jgi:hypothetical protein
MHVSSEPIGDRLSDAVPVGSDGHRQASFCRYMRTYSGEILVQGGFPTSESDAETTIRVEFFNPA